MNFPSVSNFSVSKGTGGTNPPEMYIPLWWWSGSSSLNAGISATSAIGSYLLVKGATYIGSYTSAQTKLHTLNSSWKSSLKYSFEISMAVNNSTCTLNACLWDVTSNTQVVGSTVTTTSTTFTVIRSGQFTLTPGHSYGIAVWDNTSSYSVYITDASLIVFPS